MKTTVAFLLILGTTVFTIATVVAFSTGRGFIGVASFVLTVIFLYILGRLIPDVKNNSRQL